MLTTTHFRPLQVILWFLRFCSTARIGFYSWISISLYISAGKGPTKSRPSWYHTSSLHAWNWMKSIVLCSLWFWRWQRSCTGTVIWNANYYCPYQEFLMNSCPYACMHAYLLSLYACSELLHNIRPIVSLMLDHGYFGPCSVAPSHLKWTFLSNVTLMTAFHNNTSLFYEGHACFSFLSALGGQLYHRSTWVTLSIAYRL